MQRKGGILITGLNGRTYEEKLDEFGLLSLKDRRTQLDLIQTYKFIKVGVDATRLTRHTAYHDNLIPKRSRTDVRQNFFSDLVPKTSRISKRGKNFKHIADPAGLY